MSGKFSPTLSLGDLNDFIALSQACIIFKICWIHPFIHWSKGLSKEKNLTRTQDRGVPYSLELKKASAISGKASSKSSLSQNQ
ncbi:hypothetical protein YC2023_099769 [Brassica napus]